MTTICISTQLEDLDGFSHENVTPLLNNWMRSQIEANVRRLELVKKLAPESEDLFAI